MTVDHSAIGRKSRRKGKSFEQTIALFMSGIFGETWRTTRNSGRTDVPGDVYCMSARSNFMVECKHRQDWTVSSIMKGNKSFETEFEKVAQEWRDAQRGDQALGMILFFKDPLGLWALVKCDGMDVLPLPYWRSVVMFRDSRGREWSLIPPELFDDEAGIKARRQIMYG